MSRLWMAFGMMNTVLKGNASDSGRDRLVAFRVMTSWLVNLQVNENTMLVIILWSKYLM